MLTPLHAHWFTHRNCYNFLDDDETCCSPIIVHLKLCLTVEPFWHWLDHELKSISFSGSGFWMYFWSINVVKPFWSFNSFIPYIIANTNNKSPLYEKWIPQLHSAEPLELEEKELHRLVLTYLRHLKTVESSWVGEDLNAYIDIVVPPEEIMESVELIIDHTPSSLMVPKVVKNTCEFISLHIKTEGIFRKSGAVSRIRTLKRRIESETGTFSQNDSVFDACSLLKLYLRELKTPVIPFAVQSLLTKCIQNPDYKKAVESLLLVIFLLPRSNAQLLIYLLSFLHKVAEQSSWNKMDVKNLALIFTPNFMHGPWVESKNLYGIKKTRNACKKNAENMEPYRIAVEMLIEYGDFAGWIPRGLQRYLNEASSAEQIKMITPKMPRSKALFCTGSINRVINWVQRISTPTPKGSVTLTPLPSTRRSFTTSSEVQSSSPVRRPNSTSKRNRREHTRIQKRGFLSRKNKIKR
ncbi:unnamed protein product [Allacma fusca]|uniref:Rho-GAP domain-containing protein n=1 Tax=Allacma fusca TaxID=39272 RepID=A0A8J2JUV8_9HEXA|nr:unnamed protein product [Allacma fusca]